MMQLRFLFLAILLLCSISGLAADTAPQHPRAGNGARSYSHDGPSPA
jgi:hypothetical protein